MVELFSREFIVIGTLIMKNDEMYCSAAGTKLKGVWGESLPPTLKICNFAEQKWQ